MQKSQMKQQLQDQTAFRIEVKRRFGTLASENARLHISVGGPRFEGERFTALTDFCRRRYKSTVVIISDTLQRHNYPVKEQAYELSRVAGHEWIGRNFRALEGFELARWDDLLSSPEYRTQRDNIEHLTASGAAQAALTALSMNFHKRNKVPISNCEAFLKEELAVFANLFQAPAIDIYPGAWITPLISATPHPSFYTSNIRCLSVEPVHKKHDFSANSSAQPKSISI